METDSLGGREAGWMREVVGRFGLGRGSVAGRVLTLRGIIWEDGILPPGNGGKPPVGARDEARLGCACVWLCACGRTGAGVETGMTGAGLGPGAIGAAAAAGAGGAVGGASRTGPATGVTAGTNTAGIAVREAGTGVALTFGRAVAVMGACGWIGIGTLSDWVLVRELGSDGRGDVAGRGGGI